MCFWDISCLTETLCVPERRPHEGGNPFPAAVALFCLLTLSRGPFCKQFRFTMTLVNAVLHNYTQNVKENDERELSSFDDPCASSRLSLVI